MANSYAFHPEALIEYEEAAKFYLREASQRVADEFVTAIESAVAAVVFAPERWHVVEHPEIRRYVVGRFPFVIYYRKDSRFECVTFYAIMHCSRKPDYWRNRLPEK